MSNSLIFSQMPVAGGGKNTLAIFNKQISAYKESWGNAKGFGKIGSLFSTAFGSSGAGEADMSALRKFNEMLESGKGKVEAYNATMTNCSKTTKQLAVSIAKGKTTYAEAATALETAQQSTIGLTLASTALNAAISIGIGLLIQLAVNGLSKFIHYADDAAEASETAASNISSFNNSVREQNSTISKLAPEYAELSSHVNAFGDVTGLTTDELNRYHEITNQIADMFPTLVQGYDSTGNAILRTKGNLEELNEAYKEAQRQQAWDVISENEEDIVKNANLTLNKNYGLRGTNVVYPNDALDKLLKNATSQDQFGQAASELYQEAMDKQWGFQYNALNEHIKEETGHYLSEFGTLNQEEYNAAIEAMRSYFSKVNAEYESEVAKLQDLAQSYLTLNKDFHNELDATTQNYASQLVGAIDGDTWTKIQESGGNIGDYVNNIVSSLKNDSTFRDAMTDIFSLKDADLPVDEAWQKLNDAIKILADRLQLDENTLKIQLGFEDMDSLKTKYDEALSKAQDKFKDEDVSQFFRENINTEEEIARWNKVAESANTAAEAVAEYMRVSANETPYSFLDQTDATALAERMKYINDEFENGKLSVMDYFNSLQTELDNVDWSKYTDSIEEANAMSQQFFTDTLKVATESLSDLFSKFDTKEIGVSEYLDGYMSIAETVSALTDNLQENSEGWTENGEAIDEATSSALDDTQNQLSSAIDQINSLKDSCYSMAMIMSDSVEVGTDEYSAHIQTVADDLAGIVQSGGEMAQEVSETLGTSSEEIAQNLYNNASNYALAGQAIATNTNTAIGNMAAALGDLISTLGDQIKNFKVDISFGVKNIEYFDNPTLQALFGFQFPKKVDFGVEASGESLGAIGDAVKTFGKSIQDNIASQQISLDDFMRAPTSEKYTPSKGTAPSTDKSKSGSGSGSGKSDADKAANAQKEYADKVAEIDKKLEELDKKEHLQELKDTIEESTLAVERFDDKLDLLDLKLDIFDEDDYSSRADVMAQKLDLVTQKGQALKEEFQRLSVTQPQTADEANEIASRMEKIGDSLRSNLKDWVSYSKELEEIRVDAIVQDAFKKINFEMPDISSMRNNFEQEMSAIEHNIKALKGDTLFDEVQLFQPIMPLAPKKSDAEKQADETKALHEEQLAELEEYETQIYEIRQNALEMQHAANAEAIEEERQELYESLEEAKAKLEETLGSVSESLANAATSASSSNDSVTSSFKGISSSADQAANSINKYNEAVNNMNSPQFSSDALTSNSGYNETSPKKRATGGIVGYNETTLVGERGSEAAILPDGKFVMIGENGAQLVDLPIGTKVIPADETADILSYTGRGIIGTTIPRLAEGNVGDVTVNVDRQQSAATDEQIYYNLKLQEIEYLRQLSELLKYVNSLRTTTDLTPSNRETAIGTEPTASSMTTGDSQVRDFIDTTSSAINSGLNSKNISLDGIKQQVIKSLSDKGFITEAEKTAQDSATEITDKVGKEIENTEDINLLEAMMGGEQDTTKITQDILKNFKDLPAEIQKQLGDKGVSSEDWDKMIADPSNQLEALQLLQDGSDMSWDNLPETMQTLLQTYGVTGKEQWDAFVAENPLQSYQLLIESWDAEQASVMAYINAMVDCVATGAAAVGATQIPAPQMSVESWNNLQNLIASKIQGILNTINATFNENAVDLNFNVNFEMGTATNNVQGSVSGAAAGSGNVPLYIQGDYQQPYGYKGTIATSGCGPTSMAMVLSAMTGQAIDPTVTAAWSASHGYRVDEGTSWAFFEAIGNEYGINTQNVSTSPDSLINTLASGKIMITSMGPGDFTRNGHFIVLTGVTSDGRIMVNDPNSVPKSQMTWDASRISSQCKQAWAFSYANGTKFHPGGKAIVGDEGFLKGLTRATPELIFHRDGTIDLAGINGPELRNLQRGDIVMNAHDTRRLLKGAGNDGTAIDGAPTYATGTQDAVNAIRNMFTKKASQKQSNSDSNEDIKSVTGGIEEAPQGTRIDVPDGLGKYTTYMAWSAVTATDSLQYKLRQDTGEQYNSEGFAVVNGRNVLAMTNTFGGIGDYVDVYLTNGNVIHGILGDAKHTGAPVWYDPTPANMWGHNNGQNIVEFVVQKGWNKGNPSLNGASVDYVINLGNYWGNPTFSGGANGGYLNAMNVKFNKWFNAVVEALKGELGTFSTNTHTAKRGLVDMFANGGITGDDLALIAEKKPELFYTKDGQLGLAKSPMLAKFPRGTEIISGDDTAEILKYLNPSRAKVKKFAEGTIDINSPSDRVIQAILAELFKDGFPDLEDSKNDLLKDVKEAYEWAEGKLKDLSSEEAYKSFSSLKTDKWFDENGNFTEDYHEEIEKFSKDLDDAAKETLSEFTDKVKWYNDEMLKAMNEAKDLLSDGGKNIVEFLEITGTSMTDFVKKMKEQAEMSDSESFAVYNDYLKSYNDRNLAINRLINDFLASPEELLAAKLKHQTEMAAGGEAIRNDNAFLSVLEQLGYSIEDIEGWYDETGAFTEKYLTDLETARQSLSEDMAELFQYYTESLSWYKKEWHISAGENGEFQKYIDQYGVYAQKLSMSDAIEAQNSAHQGVQDIINSEQFQDIAFKMGFAADEIESWFNRFGEVIPENFDAFIEKSREYLSEIENQDIKLPAPYDEEDIENLTTMVNDISELKKRWYLVADIPSEILNNSQLLVDSKAHRDSVTELANNVRNDKDFQNILEELGYSLDDVEQWYTATGEFTEKFAKDTEGIAEKLSEDSRKLFETSVNLIADYKKEYSLADNLIPIYEDIQLLLEGVTDIKGQRQADIDYMASQADSILADEGFNKILGAIGASLEDVETWYDSTGEFTDAYVTKMADAQQLLGEAEYQALTGYTESLQYYRKKWLEANNLLYILNTTDDILNTRDVYEKNMAYQAQMEQGGQDIRNNPEFQAVLQKAGFDISYIDNWYDAFGEFTDQYYADVTKVTAALTDSEMQTFNTAIDGLQWYKREWYRVGGDIQALQEQIFNSDIFKQAREGLYDEIIKTARQNQRDNILGLYNVEKSRILEEAETAKTVYSQAQEAWNVAYDLYQQSLTDGSSYETQQKYYEKLQECNEALGDAQDWMNSIDDKWQDVIESVIDYYNELAEVANMTKSLELSVNARRIDEIDRDYSRQQRNRTQQIRLAEKHNATLERNELLRERQASIQANADQVRADHSDLYSFFEGLGLDLELIWDAEGNPTQYYYDYKTILDAIKYPQKSAEFNSLFEGVAANKANYMDIENDVISNIVEAQEEEQELWQLGLDSAMQTADNIMNVHDNIISALQKEEEILNRQMNRTSKYTEQQSISRDMIGNLRQQLQADVNKQAEANLLKNNLYNDPRYADIISWFDTSKWVDVNGERTAAYWNDVNDLQKIGDTEMYNDAEAFVQLLGQAQQFITDADMAVEDVRDNIKSTVDAYYQQQVDAANTAVETIISMLEQRKERELKALDQVHEKRMEQLQDEAELVQKLYNNAISLLDDVKSEEDYEKQLADEQKKADNLQAQIDQYALDDSDASVQKRIELQKQLNEQLETIDELKRNHEYEQTKKALNDDMELYNDHFSKLQEAEDEQYKYDQQLIEERYTQQAMYAEAYKTLQTGVFEDFTAKGVYSYEMLYAKGNQVALDLTTAYDNFATETGAKFANMGIEFTNMIGLLNKSIELYDILNSKRIEAWNSDVNAPYANSSGIDFYGSNPRPTTNSFGNNSLVDSNGLTATEQLIVERMRQRSLAWSDSAYGEKLHEENVKDARMIGANYNDADGRWYLNGKPLYHTGKISKESQKAFESIEKNLKPYEEIAKVRLDESIFTPEQMYSMARKITAMSAVNQAIPLSALASLSKFDSQLGSAETTISNANNTDNSIHIGRINIGAGNNVTKYAVRDVLSDLPEHWRKY